VDPRDARNLHRFLSAYADAIRGPIPPEDQVPAPAGSVPHPDPLAAAARNRVKANALRASAIASTPASESDDGPRR